VHPAGDQAWTTIPNANLHMNSKKILKGFFYTLGSGYMARMFSIGLTVAIRRELGPNIFADVVLGMAVFMLLSSTREFGLPHALLHFQDQIEEFIGTHFWLNQVITGLSGLLSVAVIWVLHIFYPQTFSWTVVRVVWILAGLHFIRNLALTSEALLRLEFEFGRIALFHGLSTVVALGCALAAAWYGWREWSLVLGGWSTYAQFSLIYVLIFSTAIWLSRPLSWQVLRFDWCWARRLLGYGGWYWGGWILQMFILWYDKLVIAVAVGEREAALYENAWWLVQLPTAVISHIIFTYTNTLYSRYQNDRQQLSLFFTRILGLIFRVSAILALILMFGAYEMMALLKESWLPSAALVIWFALYAFLRPLLDEGHGLLWAVGNTRLSTRITAVQAGVALALVPGAAIWFGAYGVAASMGLVALIGLAGLGRAVRRYTTVDWRLIFFTPAIGLGVSGLLGIGFDTWWPEQEIIGLVTRSFLMGGGYIGCLWLLERKTILAIIGQARGILSGKG